MAVLEKEGEAFRKEYVEVSGSIRQFSWIRLVASAILALAFSKAFDRIGQTDLASLTETAMRQSEDAGMKRSRLELFLDALPFLEPEPINPKNDAEKTAIESMQKLRQEYHKAFTVKLEGLGTSLEIDLRAWIYATPLLLMGSELYLFVLRRRRRFVRMLGVFRYAQSDQLEAGLLDRALFDAAWLNGAYTRYPTLFVEAAAYPVTAGLLAAVVVTGRPLWSAWTAIMALLYGQAMWLSASIAIGWGWHVARAFDRQAAALTGIQARPDWLSRAEAGVRRLRDRLVSIGGVRVNLAAAGALALLSLFTATTEVGCGDTRRPGRDIVRGKASWHNATFAETFQREASRAAYTSGLVLAVISGVIAVGSRKITRFTRLPWVRRALLGLACAVGLFTIGDSVGMAWLAIFTWIPYWAAPIAISAWASAYPSKSAERWATWRPLLFLAMAPVFVVALLTAIGEAASLPGLAAFVIGVNWLWMSYLSAVGRRDPLFFADSEGAVAAGPGPPPEAAADRATA